MSQSALSKRPADVAGVARRAGPTTGERLARAAEQSWRPLALLLAALVVWWAIAAAELIEQFFGADRPGSGAWTVAGKTITDRIGVPALHFTAGRDRIAPAATAPAGDIVPIAAGHVGMIVGRAREQLHSGLRRFLDPACR